MFSSASVIEALLIVTALSVDAFVSGFAYGANKIKIPFVSVAVISLVCKAVLTTALFFGAILSRFIPESVITLVCFLILFALGSAKLFDSAIKILIRKHTRFNKNLRFSFFSLKFILNIYADPGEADIDSSKILSPREAAYLAAALSLDGLTVGFGAGLAGASPVLVIGFSLITDMVGVILGCRLGNKIAKRFSLELSWLSGALLIALGFMKLG